MFDALAFDLDGTLWNATAACLLGWNNGLVSLKLDKAVTLSKLKSVTGKPLKECLQILLPDELAQHPELIAAISRYEEIVLKRKGGEFYAGLHETLEQLARQYDLFLVSNCQEWYLEVFFRFSKVKKYFRDWDCYGRSGQTKKEMLQKLKVNYDLVRPAYVGDTEGDELAARQAGYAFIFAAYGFGVSRSPEIAVNSLPELGKTLRMKTT
jgi:phosphoglycolate phosphatase